MDALGTCFETTDWASCLAEAAGVPLWLAALIGFAAIALVLRLIVGPRSRADDEVGPFDMT